MKISDELKEILEVATGIAKKEGDEIVDIPHVLAAVQCFALAGLEAQKLVEKHNIERN